MKSVYRNIGSFSKVFALVAVAGFGLASCDNKEDTRYWDEDPIIRIDKAKAEMKRHLVEESPNGWIVSFSPDGGKYLGEFNLWFDFKDDWSLELKTDLDRGDLGVEKSEYNFVMLRTFALSFPNFNKVHAFTEFDPWSLRTDIEFMYNNYLDNGDVETIGYMSNKKVVFRKATTEDKAFVFPKMWATYDRLQATSEMQITYNGKPYKMDYTAITDDESGIFYRMGLLRSHAQLGNVTSTGAVTFAADREGDVVKLTPALEIPDGSVIDELIWTGSAFIGVSDTGTASVSLK